MAAQVQALTSAVQAIQAQLAAGEAGRVALAQELRQQRARAQAAQARVGVDTRNLGRPSQVQGTDAGWRDWSVVFRSYAELVNATLAVEMGDKVALGV